MTNPANYATDRQSVLSGSSQWSNPESDPIRDIDDAKENVRQGAGLDPNRLVVSKPTYTALKNHPKIVERYKYTTQDSITPGMLAALFDLETFAVGKSAVLEGIDDDAKFIDVWGNQAVLAYTPTDPQGMEEPSYGYTYTLKGCPFAEQPFWNAINKSWMYGVTYDRVPVLTGISSGFLFQNVVSTGA